MDTAPFHIVITDRNSHVRELLFRELLREGYRVTEAKDSAHLLTIFTSSRPVDLLILDPEVCNLQRCSSITLGETRVILHALVDTDSVPLPPGLANAAACVDKTGDLDELKRVVRELLMHSGSAPRGTDNV
ncbi:MAG: hypothetical protein KKE73_08505 [Proteobacteria bacterium]|nr:hypothetical protein [Pseudomonadota bacterium]